VSEPLPFKDFKKLDLRVAEIVEAKLHPNADKLLLLDIAVGGEVKQVVAGIRGQYEPADLKGRKVVVVNNLEPATIRGEISNGMILAASDGDKIILLQPDKACASGARVS